LDMRLMGPCGLYQEYCSMQDSILYFHPQQGVARKAYHCADPII
jgi:hypothetical protein